MFALQSPFTTCLRNIFIPWNLVASNKRESKRNDIKKESIVIINLNISIVLRLFSLVKKCSIEFIDVEIDDVCVDLLTRSVGVASYLVAVLLFIIFVEETDFSVPWTLRALLLDLQH